MVLPPPVIGGLNLKICQNFVEMKICRNFSYICGGINLYGGNQNFMRGVIFVITLSLFHLFRNSYHPENWSASFMNFFRKWECIRSCYLLISSNLRKRPFKKTSLLFLPRQLLCKRCSDMLSVNISSYYCNSCNQNPWKISFKKFSFRNEFLETFCKYINPGFKPQILEHLFWRTAPLAVSDPCSILVDNTSYILVDIDCIVLFRRI